MYKKHTVVVIGNGPWSRVYIQNIENHSALRLVYRISDVQFDEPDIHLHQLEQVKPDVVIIATNPTLQLRYIKNIAEIAKIIIAEKPVAIDTEEHDLFIEVLNQYPNKLVVNFPHMFNEKLIELSRSIKNKNRKIDNILIKECGKGPYRRRINPVFDWFPHVSSILQLCDVSLSNIDLHEKISGVGRQYHLKARTNYDCNLDCWFGNGFSKKERSITFTSHAETNHTLDLTQAITNDVPPMMALLNRVIDKLNGINTKLYHSQTSDVDIIRDISAQTIYINEINHAK